MPPAAAYSTRTEHGAVRQSAWRGGSPSKPPTEQHGVEPHGGVDGAVDDLVGRVLVQAALEGRLGPVHALAQEHVVGVGDPR